MLALIGSLDLTELMIIAAGAVIVFGKQLPEVTMRGAAQVMKLRKAVTDMWREAGLEQELRRIQHEVQTSVPKVDGIPKSAHDLLTSRPRPRPTPPLGAPDEDAGAAAVEADSLVNEDLVHDPLAREHLGNEPGHELGDDPDGPPADLGHGPSEEERRAESGKDLAGHGAEDRVAELPVELRGDVPPPPVDRGPDLDPPAGPFGEPAAPGSADGGPSDGTEDGTDGDDRARD